MKIAPVLMLVLVGLTAFTFAQAPAEGTKTWTHPDTSGPGWRDLFNNDMSNAIRPKAEDGGEIWTTTDGVLTANEDQAIWTKEVHGNCVLDLEFKNEPGTNSGVIVYASDIDNWIPNSVEIQIADDFSEKWSKVSTTWQCGAIFGRLGATNKTLLPAGEWNHFTVYCEGKNLHVVLNGKLVTAMDMSKWTDAKHNPDGSEIPEWLSRPLAELTPRGHIGLQGKHGDASIHFRNIRIKDLP